MRQYCGQLDYKNITTTISKLPTNQNRARSQNICQPLKRDDSQRKLRGRDSFSCLSVSDRARNRVRKKEPRTKGASIFDVHKILGFFDTPHPILLCPANVYYLSANLGYILTLLSPFCSESSDVIYGSPRTTDAKINAKGFCDLRRPIPRIWSANERTSDPQMTCARIVAFFRRNCISLCCRSLPCLPVRMFKMVVTEFSSYSV